MQIDVIKEWKNTKGKELPKDITVKLSLPGKNKNAANSEVATLQLSAKDQWRGTFKDLAIDDRYKIDEVTVNGYKTTYSKLEKIADNHYQIKITNTLSPTIPNKPGNPNTPRKKHLKSNNSEVTNKTYPKTGEQKTSGWTIIGGIILVLLMLYILKKGRNK